jgi:hypothetical protein
MARDSRSVPKCELLIYTRQFSYEWQTQNLQDTENERVRKRMKGKGEESGDGQVMNDDFAMQGRPCRIDEPRNFFLAQDRWHVKCFFRIGGLFDTPDFLESLGVEES